ncbi:hypothetical protein BKA65DRAFT_508199 [Rhexocercosporidium sp. MPI-PUGE-AT-0058]|nr:hypothetical protein BKA65DRAFT_508199 [Rhexocercosporidium sp. MPI-PUGE-AT-0058]
MQFMTIEVLEGKSHKYRHDLESFFYVFVWMCIRYGYGGTGRQKPKKVMRPKTNILRGWYTGVYTEIANTKQGHVGKIDLRTLSRSLRRSLRTSRRCLASSDPLSFQLGMGTYLQARSTTTV